DDRRLRRQGAAPAGQERPGGDRSGGAALRRGAAAGRDVPGLDGAGRRRQGDRRRAEGAGRVPAAGGRPRVLRRLRRDRSLRGQRRRRRVRRRLSRHGDATMSFLVDPPSLPVPAFTDDELAELNAEFERLPAPKIIQWAVDNFSPHLSLAASMADALLIDLATRVDPGIEVVFIDTGYHFPETLETVERIRRHYGLNLRIMTVAHHAAELWKVDPENCCSAVKVGQLDRALAGKQAWMSGLRRDEAPTRANAPIVARDLRGLVKVNPIANWTEADVDAYMADRDIPYNPLLDQGYPSIGCWPCTSKVAEGEDPRSGRWAGQGKTECGLHLS